MVPKREPKRRNINSFRCGLTQEPGSIYCAYNHEKSFRELNRKSINHLRADLY